MIGTSTADPHRGIRTPINRYRDRLRFLPPATPQRPI